MNLSQLNYFKKLAEVLHYTRAAQELFITQPTLSGAISSLEKELGAPLFERNGRSVLLTPYGEVFYEHVCLALRAIDDGVAAVSARSSASFGTVNLGHYLHHPGPLPAEPHPRLRGGLRQAGHREGVPGIHQLPHRAAASGHAGCGLLRQARQRARHRLLPGEALRGWPLFVRDDHPLASRETITFGELNDVDLHTYRRGTPIGERVAKMLEEADVRGASLGYDDDVSMGSFLSYNGGNAGALMLDSLGVQLFSNLHQVRVEGIPEHFYTVYMAYHKKHVHSRAVADFIDFVKAYPGNDLVGQVLPTAPAE